MQGQREILLDQSTLIGGRGISCTVICRTPLWIIMVPPLHVHMHQSTIINDSMADYCNYGIYQMRTYYENLVCNKLSN